MNNSFHSLEVPPQAKIEIKESVLYLSYFNWDYSDFLIFQKKAQDFIRKNKKLKIYIFCNHPHCFTLGRGNERGEENLIDFDQSLIKTLDFPVHQIHRGGGITFHYPGQWIFYPIVSINERYNLEQHMCWILKSVSTVIKKDFGVERVLSAKKLMGVWLDKKKLASIGVGLNRFITEHGLALNLVHDEKMFDELKKINPCGMNPTVYTCLDQFIEKTELDLIKAFHLKFLSSL